MEELFDFPIMKSGVDELVLISSKATMTIVD